MENKEEYSWNLWENNIFLGFKYSVLIEKNWWKVQNLQKLNLNDIALHGNIYCNVFTIAIYTYSCTSKVDSASLDDKEIKINKEKKREMREKINTDRKKEN